jgi:hypothetical protein
MRYSVLKAFLFVATGLTVSARGEAAYILHTATYGGHTYHLVAANQNLERIHWAPAQAFAVSLGGNLVTVNDAAENTFLLNTFGPIAIAAANAAHPNAWITSMWIGLNDVATEGNWVWVSGEPVTYTNWKAGEPTTDDAQDYAAILVDFRFGSPGEWHDVFVDFRANDVTYGLIEIASINVVPEPGSIALFAFGIAAMCGVRAVRRRI